MRPSGIAFALAALALMISTVPAQAFRDLDPSASRPPHLSTLLAVQRRAVPGAVVTSGFHDWRATSKYRSRAGEHLGYDIAMPAGSPAVAGWRGRVTRIVPWYKDEQGITVLSPNGYEATYGPLRPKVAVGAELQPGDVVGIVVNDHVDVKMRGPDGLYYDFGANGTGVASKPAPRPPVAAQPPPAKRNPPVAYAPRPRGDGDASYRPSPNNDGDSSYRPAPNNDGDSPAGDDGDGNNYDGNDGGGNDRDRNDGYRNDGDRNDGGYRPRTDDRAPRTGQAAPRRSRWGSRPPQPRCEDDRGTAYRPQPSCNEAPRRRQDPQERAEALRRYVRARYSVDLTREEADRIVAAERAAMQAVARHRRTIDDMARRVGWKFDERQVRDLTARAAEIAAQVQHLTSQEAAVVVYLRKAERELEAARLDLQRLGIREP